MEFRKLTPTDAAAFRRLRRQGLVSSPEAFGESVEELDGTPEEQYAERLGKAPLENFVVGAFDGETLTGTVGFHRELRRKRRHKGAIWGVFVAPEYRGSGVAKRLLEETLMLARELPGLEIVQLSVASTQSAARNLYAGAGFRTFGLEPRALKFGDRYIDEEHMTLELHAP